MSRKDKRMFIVAMKYCTECGKRISEQAAACPGCGYPNKSLSTNINRLYNGDKSIAVYLVLCWFLGIVGAHRYYAGKTGSAITMTILTITIIGILITSIWTLVDLIVGFCNISTPEKIFKK